MKHHKNITVAPAMINIVPKGTDDNGSGGSKGKEVPIQVKGE
jgi:hypothetical protein